MEWQKYETPCYVIDTEKFKENCMAITEPFEACWDGKVEFGYSVKTNHHEALMRYAAENLGWYIETVSPDEYAYALTMVKPQQIILNGPCKRECMIEAYEAGSILNLDHIREVEELCVYVKENKDAKTNVEVGLRVNFNLEELCPGETTAGEAVSRFGICYENGDLSRAVELLTEAGIAVSGLHLHTSTKSRSAGVFRALSKMTVEIAQRYKLRLKFIDMGGGYFGGQKVPGKPTMDEYADVICTELRKYFRPDETRLILEPGASVLATSVEYLSRVINVRDIRGVKVATLDGTTLHINPFMSHRVPPYKRFSAQSCEQVEKTQLVCGATCMENDRFLELEDEKAIREGDMFAFRAAGAYTMAFNSEFILALPRVYVE